jgi:hypothetical protein
MNSTTWKDVLGYEDVFEVSSNGIIRRKGKDKHLSTRVNGNGYEIITLCHNGNRQTHRIHRIVMNAFYGNKPLDVNHKNGIKTDNRLENLEYCTRRENIAHARDVLGVVGGDRHTPESKPRQFKHLTESSVRAIRDAHSEGTSQIELSKLYGVSIAAVNRIINRVAWADVQ